jgi:hypothetical protein
METELRRSPRVPFIASAVNPLPHGTAVKIAIVHGARTFTASAAVVYSQTPLGMGLEFHDFHDTDAPRAGKAGTVAGRLAWATGLQIDLCRTFPPNSVF